jgi:outer membrane protein
MKKIMLLVAVLCFTSASYGFVVGKVDVKQILESVDEGAKAKTKLQDLLAKKQGELKGEEEKIRKMQEEFQKQSLVMNDKAKAAKQQEIQGKVMALQQQMEKSQQELHEKEKEMMGPLLQKLNDVIVQTSKDAGVDITFEVRSTPVVYSKQEKDLSPIVIKAYNSKYPAK